MSVLDDLDERNLISPKAKKLRYLVDNNFSDLYTSPIICPSKYVSQMYDRYLGLPSSLRSRSMNGSIFHLIVAVVLYRSGIEPLHQETKITFVPHAIFDIVAYKADDEIICFSLKVSSRERWKQADLEARALKMVHRNAKCFIIFKEENDAKVTQKKIDEGGAIALDDSISAVTTKFDDLIASLKATQFIYPPTVPVMEHTARSSIRK